MADAALNALPITVSDELESPARRALRRLLKRKGAVAGIVVIAAFVLLALFAPLVVPCDPIATSWSLVRKAPSAQHWFGTDDLGRDIFARVIYGAQVSLRVGLVGVVLAGSIGFALGATTGYLRGIFDDVVMRLIDIVLAFPPLILAMAIASFLGPDLTNSMLAIAIVHIPN